MVEPKKKMNLVVVVDVELFPNGIVKEIGMYRNGTIIGLSFCAPFPYEDLEKWEKRQTKWLTKNLHKIEWSSGEIPYDYLPYVIDLIREPQIIEEKQLDGELWWSKLKYISLIEKEDSFPTGEIKLQREKSTANDISGKLIYFAKGLQKCTLLSSIFHEDFVDLDTILCPTAEELHEQYMNTEKISECAQYPVEHGGNFTKHCAQKKVHLFGIWLQKQQEYENFVNCLVN